MKIRLLAISLILFAGLSAAQTQNSTASPNPGLVKAGGLLHGLDVAVDNAMVAAGFRSAGDVAFERASEVAVARDRNNTKAAVQALDRFNSAVAEANNQNKERLKQAEHILKNVSEMLPEQADYGISNALENVQRAKQHIPESLTTGSEGGLPDIKLPGNREQEIESPAGGEDHSREQ